MGRAVARGAARTWDATVWSAGVWFDGVVCGHGYGWEVAGGAAAAAGQRGRKGVGALRRVCGLAFAIWKYSRYEIVRKRAPVLA